MDTFIDKLAQKNKANEMIDANTEAEARENKRIRDQLAGYEQLLEEMKQVNLKNLESASKVSEMIDNASESVSRAPQENYQMPAEVTAGISREDMEELKGSFAGISD